MAVRERVGSAPGRARTPSIRVLLVSRGRYTVPPAPDVRRKHDAMITSGIDLRVLAAGAGRRVEADPVLRLVPASSPRALDGVLFYLRLPARVARELREFEPDVVVVQGVHECVATLLARSRAKSPARIVLDVQGDWRAATRLYGSRLRSLLNPVSDMLGGIAVRRADAIRTLGPYTSGLVRQLGVEPIATLPTYVDRVAVAADPVPLPAAPRALFVGALERCKGVDTLLDAWPIVAARLPDARLWIVGRGARAESMAARWSREGATRVQWTPSLANGEVARALDESTVLVVPSAMEGMGRVVVEAFARGRPVIGTRGGGIADLVQDGRNGLLVDPGDPAQLADALVRVLEDGALASRLGAGALESTDGWLFGADEWAVRFRDLVCRAALPAPAAGYNRWPRPT